MSDPKLTEAVKLLHQARSIVQQMQQLPTTSPIEAAILTFLANSEEFLAEACGEKVGYEGKKP